MSAAEIPAVTPAVGPDVPPATLADVEAALADGAGCARLFEVRNRMDPKDPQRFKANHLLRSVGCHAPWHTREADR